MVDDVGQLLDVEPASGQVSGDEQIRGRIAQVPYYPVASFFAHPAVNSPSPLHPSPSQICCMKGRCPSGDCHGRVTLGPAGCIN